MSLKKIHYWSGLILLIFIALHLLNHLFALGGAERHIAFMNSLRLVYRNIVAETLLLLAVAFQVFSGIKLWRNRRRQPLDFFAKVQIWSGLYLAFFFVNHVLAVVAGRLYLQLDTNYYFGAAGLNSFPLLLFFLPYYSLAILAFFGHLAAVHHYKMKKTLLGLSPNQQAKSILALGAVVALLVIYAMTNGFAGAAIPDAYQLLK